MRKILIIYSVFLLSFTIISCSEKDESSDDNTATDNTSTTDTTAPVIAEVTAVTTPTDTTPDYTFSSDEAGTITYGGSCSSSTTSAISGNNTITLVSLSTGTYSDCTITVTDTCGNASSLLTITSFTVFSSYVAVANSGYIISSSDGTNWTKRTSGTTQNLNGITYGNNKFIIVGNNGTTLTSSDVTSWTSISRSGEDNSSISLSDITYAE